MCQVKVRSCGSSGGGGLAGLALVVGAGALVVSVVGSVLEIARLHHLAALVK